MLLAEATKCYNSALEKVQSDSAEAKQGFSDAADKYQLLVSAGVANSRLYFNLANAYLESGQTDRAIANYLRCLRIEPTMYEAQLNLAHARKTLRSQASPVDAKGSDSSLVAYAVVGNEWLNSRISPHAVFVVMAVAWIAIWTFIGVRVLGFRLPWKTAMSAPAVMFTLAAASSLLSGQTSGRRMAVIVQSPAASAADTEVTTAKIGQGQVVEPIQKRGDSIRVRTESGETIWLPADSVEVI
jgi:tetratricopeptide (TPR) repeat protein